MNGSVTPVRGINPVVPPITMIASIKKIEAAPKRKLDEKPSRAITAEEAPLSQMTMNKTTTDRPRCV